MKKYLILPGLTAVVIISMSFIIIGPKKINKQNTFSIKKPTCDLFESPLATRPE
jgi:hypothetical protein